jgi:hypothetical protein
MRLAVFIAAMMCLNAKTNAQTINDYFLAPASSITLNVNQTVTLKIGHLDAKGDITTQKTIDIGITQTPHWMVNGHDISISSNDGDLSPDLTFLTATYKAPPAVPSKNPVAVAVSFHPADSAKELVTLICNITIVDAPYEIDMESEVTGPEGIHFHIKGKSFAILHSFADGTYSLQPSDGTKNMEVQVLEAVAPKMSLVSPKNYNIHYVCNLGNLKKSAAVSAKFTIESFSPRDNMERPIKEEYQTPVGIQAFPVMLNGILRNCVPLTTIVNTANENGTKAAQDMDFVQRLKSHEGDPSYLKTVQGKADLLQMQKFMQEQGRGNLFTNTSQQPTHNNSSDYSKAFVQGMQSTQTNPETDGIAPNTNTPTLMGGEYHLDGTFHTGSTTPMTINIANNSNGFQGSLKINVIKLHN